MRSSLATMCSRFIENRDIVKSTFVWDSTYMYPIIHMCIVPQNRTAILPEVATAAAEVVPVEEYKERDQ